MGEQPGVTRSMGSGRSASRVVLVIALAACLLAAWARPADCDEVDPAKVALVQAVYLYKFTKLIRWPAAAFPAEDAPFVIGVIDAGDVAVALEEGIPEQPAGERTTVVRRLDWRALEKTAQTAAALRECHVLFIPASLRDEMPRLSALIGDASILTVGNSRYFAMRDGMIEFFLDGDRVGIRINVDRLNRRNLKVSSRLLKLAAIVEDGGS
jgi:hypothetical protein